MKHSRSSRSTASRSPNRRPWKKPTRPDCEVAMTNATTHERSYEIQIPADHLQLDGDLVIPKPGAHGLVIFAHGSGSSRFSSRNRFVAEQLRDTGLATLLMDLLTPREEQVDQLTAHLRFDIGLLADRLVAAMRFANVDPRMMDLPIGL